MIKKKVLLALGVLGLPIFTGGCMMDIWEYGAQNRNAKVIYNYNGTGKNYTSYSGSNGNGAVSFDTCVWVLTQRLDVGTSQQACQVYNAWTPGSLGYIEFP